MADLKAILFDLDGTLLDSFSLHYSAYETMFATFGIEMKRGLFLRSYSPNWYRTYEAFGLAEEHWESANELWLEAAAAHAPELFPGVKQLLEDLRTRYDLGIVTSGSRSRVVNDLRRLEIANYFSTVVTGDDITEPKPAPESLELALSHLSVPPARAVYIGDAHADFEMSQAAGVPFIGVPSEFANLTHGHPDYEIHPVAALPDVIALLTKPYAS